MKRRIRWPEWIQRIHGLTAGRRPMLPAAQDVPWRMPLRIDLRFRDGSTVRLDPASPIALEIHQIADQWLTGR